MNVNELLDQLTLKLQKYLESENIEDPVLIGIHTGGLWVARHLHQTLDVKTPLGELDISFYRDDFSTIGVHPQVKPSHIPVQLDDRNVVLVDDVLHTGRTIRAAMNELFDYGRPKRIVLASLVERSGRELPIRADVCALQLDLDQHEYVRLSGPEPLSLSISQGGE